MIYDEDPFRRSRRNRQQVKTTGGVCLNVGKPVQMGLPTQENREIRSSGGGGNYSVPSTVARLYDFREPGGYLGNVGLNTCPIFWDHLSDLDHAAIVTRTG